LKLSATSSGFALSNHLFLVQIIPLVNLQLDLASWKLALDKILVTGDDKSLLLIVMVIWRVEDEQQLANLSSIGFNPLKIISNPSMDIR
jgi:hypothetical protein